MTAPATRRTALRTGLAGLAATIAAPALARAVTPGADAQLIRHCGELVDLCARQEALVAIRVTIADEVRTEPEMDRLRAAEENLLGLIDAAGPPTTPAGARAVARGALAIAPRWASGAVMYEQDFEWLLVSVVEFVAGQEEHA